MESHSDDPVLVADLEALRPAPRPAFTVELDARVAGGFPPAASEPSWFERCAETLRAMSWRGLIAPAGAAALVAIAAATAVVSLSESETTPTTDRLSEVTRFAGAPSDRPLRAAGQAERAAPSTGEGAAGVQPFAGSLSTAESSLEMAPSSGPYAARVDRREIERSARVVLAAEPSEVRAAAAEVFSVVHAYDGIVLRSAIRDLDEGEAIASFDLLVPSGELDDALAGFSAIAEVRSRSDSTVDVTAPTIGLRERLRDAQARVDGLLAQLARADTDDERTAVEAELRTERNRVAALRSRLTSLQRRTNFARVSLRVESGAGASETSGGNWGIQDALDDAWRILGVAAGVTVIGLAIVGPIALILLLAIAARRIWLRRSRERTLEGRTTS